MLLAAPAFGQEGTNTFKLENIKYTHEQEAFTDEEALAVTDINAEEIKESNVSSIDDVVRLTPGASTSRGPRSFGESIQVRGLDSQKVFVYIDGVKQNYKAGHTSMIATDVENLVAVKIHKSSGDLSKSGSLGGGVSFRTIEPKDLVKRNSKTTSVVKYQNNSANTENIYNIKSAFKNNGQQALVSYSKKKAHNLNLNDETELENSAYEEANFLGKVYFNDLKFAVENFERSDTSPLDPSLNPPNRIQSLLADNKIIKTTVSAEYQTDSNKFQVYRNKQEVVKTNREENIKAIREIETYGASYKGSINEWKLGLDFVSDELESSKNGEEIISYPNASRLVNSAFVEKSFKYRKITSTPGLKLQSIKLVADSPEFENIEHEVLSKKLELTLEPNEKTSIFANYIESVNAPNVGEVFPSGLHSKGDDFIIRDNYFIPNLNLKPEHSEQRELGYTLTFEGFGSYDQFKFSHSYYENNIKDYIYLERIDRSTLDDYDGTTQFVNIDEVKLQGQELSLTYVNDRVELGFAYTTVRGENESLGIYLEDLPADFYTISSKYYNEESGLSLGYLGLVTQEQNRVNEDTIQRTEKTPGYFIHNVFMSKKIGKYFETNLRVDNLGNKKYRRHGSHLYESREDYKVAINFKI